MIWRCVRHQAGRWWPTSRELLVCVCVITAGALSRQLLAANSADACVGRTRMRSL